MTKSPALVRAPRSTAAFSRLIHLIYAAAAQPLEWSGVVEAIARSLNASKGLLFTPFLGPQHGGMIFPWQISEDQLQLWGTHYIEHDIWAAAVVNKGLWLEGTAVVDEQLVPREIFQASVFYRNFLSGMGIGRLCTGIVFEGASGLPATALSVFRDFDDPAYDAEDTAWMKLLVPHLSRALGLMHRLGSARLQAASLLASLDRLAFGVVLLNEESEVLHLNQAAREVLERRDGLALWAKRFLEPTARGAPASFSRWLTESDAACTTTAHFSECFVVPRSGGASHYAIQRSALPVTPGWSAQGQDIRFVAFITDPAAVRLPDVQRLCELYGFTKTQARVACELALGGSYQQVAQRLKISEHTVRAHVKAIYPKARVNRQADLVRSILSLGQVAV